MSDAYIKSHKVWEGSITISERRRARVIELGHMESKAPSFAVEVEVRDALDTANWIGSVDGIVIHGALSGYIMALRGRQ